MQPRMLSPEPWETTAAGFQLVLPRKQSSHRLPRKNQREATQPRCLIFCAGKNSIFPVSTCLSFLTRVARIGFCDLYRVKEACVVYIFSKSWYLTWSDKPVRSCEILSTVQKNENCCFSGLLIMNKWHKYVKSGIFDVYRDRSNYGICNRP